MSTDDSLAAAKNLLKGVTDILSFPDVALRINQMVQSQAYSASQIAKEIETAPDIAAGILRLANCAIYAFPKAVESIHRAITLIGNEAVRDIVLAIAAKSTLGAVSAKTLDMGQFWRHSVYCAALARCLAQRDGGAHRDVLFTAGLLHDIGRLVIARQVPEVAAEIQRQECPDRPIHELELESLGFHHGTLGGLLAERWQFPETLVACIFYHHNPFQAQGEHRDAVRLVHLANALCPLLENAQLSFSDLNLPFPGILDDQGLDENGVYTLIDDVRLSIGDLGRVFGVAA